MRTKKRRYRPRWPGAKHCELCHGRRGGARGNNVVIDGQRVCDYCHAERL